MSLIILNGADFSGTGLGKVQSTRGGITANGLTAFWNFLSPAPGSGTTLSTVRDVSGQGNHATLYDGYDTPTLRSYGAAVADVDGAIYSTGLPGNVGQRTVFVAATNTLPGSENGVFNTFFASDANGYDTNPTNVNGADPFPSLVYNGGGASGSARFYAPDDSIFGEQFLNPTGSPDYGDVMVVAVTIDAANNQVRVAALGESWNTATNAGVSAYFDGSSDRGNLVIGAWPFQGTRSAQTNIARLHGIAVYDTTLTDAEAQAIMAQLRAAVVE